MIVEALNLLKSKLSSKLNSSDKRAKIQDSDFVVALIPALAGAKSSFTLSELRLSVTKYLGIDIGSSAFNERLGTLSLSNDLQLALEVLMGLSMNINADGTAALLANKLEVTEIVGTDGSLVTLWDALSKHFKGTFMNSAIKLHMAINLVSGSISWFDLTKGSLHDSQRFPDINPGSLHIFDLGYWSLAFLQSFSNQSAYYLSRVRSDAKFTVTKVISGFGQSHIGSDLLGIPIYKKRNSIVEVLATHIIDDIEVEFRIIGFWNSKTHRYHWYVTNLKASRGIVRELYRLRWQVELSFKSLKSTLNFDRMPTTRPNAVVSLSLIALINYMFSVIFRQEAEALAQKNNDPRVGTSSIQKAVKAFREVVQDVLGGLKIGKKMTNAWIRRLRKTLKPFLAYIFDPNYKHRKNTANSLINM